MRVLLTSAGLETEEIKECIMDMAGKDMTLVKALFIPTAAIDAGAINFLFPKCTWRLGKSKRFSSATVTVLRQKVCIFTNSLYFLKDLFTGDGLCWYHHKGEPQRSSKQQDVQRGTQRTSNQEGE